MKDTNDIQDKLDGNKQNIDFSSSSSSSSSSSNSDDEQEDVLKKEGQNKPKNEKQKKPSETEEHKIEERSKTKGLMNNSSNPMEKENDKKKNLIVLEPIKEDSGQENSQKEVKNSEMSFQVSEFHSNDSWTFFNL